MNLWTPERSSRSSTFLVKTSGRHHKKCPRHRFGKSRAFPPNQCAGEMNLELVRKGTTLVLGLPFRSFWIDSHHSRCGDAHLRVVGRVLAIA